MKGQEEGDKEESETIEEKVELIQPIQEQGKCDLQEGDGQEAESKRREFEERGRGRGRGKGRGKGRGRKKSESEEEKRELFGVKVVTYNVLSPRYCDFKTFTKCDRNACDSKKRYDYFMLFIIC